MNIETQKLNLINKLIQIYDESILKRIEKFLDSEIKTEQDSKLKPMSFEDLENKLVQSSKDIENGKLYTTDQIKKLFNI